MTSQNGGRNSRRGGRGRSRRRSGDAQGRSQPRPSAAPVKKGLWAKITSFFSAGNGANPPSASTGRNGARPASASGSATAEAAEPVARPARKPQSVEVTTPRLYVGNLSFDATESDLLELFKGVGEVQNAEVVTYKHNQRSKGFAFVQMQTVDEAKRAVSVLHDKEFLGRKLVVSGAKANEHARN